MRYAAVVTAALALLLPAAAAAADRGVSVSLNGHGSVFLSADDINGHGTVNMDHSQRGTVQGQNGAPADDDGFAYGVAARTLATLAHVDPDNIETMAFANPDTGSDVVLTQSEVRDGFPNAPGVDEAVVNDRGTLLHFYRPPLDGSDWNGRDLIDARVLQVTIATENKANREVDAHLDDDTPNPGESVTFDALAKPSSVNFVYHWDFGNGERATGAAVTRSFPAGHYQVTATAIGDDGSSGVSDPVEVQVGSPAQATPTASPESQDDGGQNQGVGGPGGGGGEQNGGGGIKDGGSTGPQTSHGNHDRPHSTPTPKPGRTPRATPTSVATPVPSATIAPQTSDPPPATVPLQTSTPASTPAAKPGRTPPKHAATPAPTLTPAGTPVDGVLIEGAGDPLQAAQILKSLNQPTPDDEEHTPSRQGGGGSTSLGGWLGGGAVFLVLLGAGALREGGLRRHTLPA